MTFITYEVLGTQPGADISLAVQFFKKEEILQLNEQKLVLRIDAKDDGQKRFSAFWKDFNPQKEYNHLLRKVEVMFAGC